jgi:hypothetical protein
MLKNELIRAFYSANIWLAIIIQTVILFTSGEKSEIFTISVPIICTLPYTTAALTDIQSGFVKPYIVRSDVDSYIGAKLIACILSGGLCEIIGALIYMAVKKVSMYPQLLFLSGGFWALLSATLCVWSKSRYIAYGSAFVIYYLMVILNERYFPLLYCLNPTEWISFNHKWIYGQWGIVIMLLGLIGIFSCLYYMVVRRMVERL